MISPNEYTGPDGAGSAGRGNNLDGESMAGRAVSPNVQPRIRQAIQAKRPLNVPGRVTAQEAEDVAKSAVGKYPGNAARPSSVTKPVSTGLSQSEKAQVSIKQPVKSIKSAAGPKTMSDIQTENKAAKEVARKQFKQAVRNTTKVTRSSNITEVQPSESTTKPTTDDTHISPRIALKRAQAKAPVPRSGGDVPNETKLKLENAAKNPANTFARSRSDIDTAARKTLIKRVYSEAAEGQATRRVMNKQYKESGTTFRNPANGKLERTTTNVANPMNEPAARNEAEARVNRGLKEIEAREKANRLGK